MWGDWLSADDIIAMVDDMAADAKRPAFAHRGHTHFYSGPNKEVFKQISGVLLNNHARAVVRAARLGGTIIDDTRVGKFLNAFQGIGSAIISGKGTFDYFDANPHVADAERANAAIMPWGHASRLFALSSWGHVTTTVCGASRGGIYYTLEIPYNLNDAHIDSTGIAFNYTIRELFTPRQKPIEFINMLPFKRVEAGYTPIEWENAHRLICLGEQRMALHEALEGVKPASIRKALTNAADQVLLRPIESYEFFLESREAYRVDRDMMLKATTAKPRKSALEPPAVRQNIRELALKEFALMAVSLVKTELELLPPDLRPNIPAFSIVGGKTTVKL